jgi:hypothetical protein
MNQNAHSPTLSSPTRIRGVKEASFRATAWAHLFGLLAFGVGLFAWYAMLQIPTGHPALGGPDPGRVLLVLLVLTSVCAALATVVVIHSMIGRRWARLLYAIPPGLFACVVLGQIVLSMT